MACIAKIMDPDQTAPMGAVWLGFIVFDKGATMTCVFMMKAHQKAVTWGCWSGTAVIATGTDDQTITFWYVHQKPAIQKAGDIYR